MEKNEYHLIIDINDSGGGGSGAIAESKQKDTANKQLNAFKKLVKYEVVRPFISSTKQMIMNNVDTYIGSQEVSQRIQFAVDGAKTVYSTWQQGVVLSAAFGLTKMGGFGLSLALTAGQKLLDIAVKQNEINNKMYLENQQLSILRGRAGAQFNRSRTGE